MSPDLSLALSLADQADTISLGRFRARDLHVETKPDLAPLSEADRAVETAIRDRLAKERPDDGLLGRRVRLPGWDIEDRVVPVRVPLRTIRADDDGPTLADGALELDTSDMTVDEIVDELAGRIGDHD